MSNLIQKLLRTDADYVYTFLRIICGIIILPYGLQKLGFRGVGIKATLLDLKTKKVPQFIAWLIIISQSFGSVALIIGLLGRFAAGGAFIIFTGALVVHSPDGWMLNWFGKKKGEGIEYFVMLLAILLIIIIKGSGAMSIDFWLMNRL
jgi:putative oxidoreductase